MKLYSNISSYFLIWFLIIVFVSYFSFLTLPHSGLFSNEYLKNFSNWDGGHFIGISRYGYSQNIQYAFFPLYPILIKIVNQVLNNYLISALLISIVSSYLGLQLLYKLILLDFEKAFAEKIVINLLIFPTSFYFLTAYSEGLFFLLIISTFYFFRKKKIFLTIVFAILACLTRLAGLAMVLGLLVEILFSTGINKKNWYILFAPLGFFIYCFYLYNQTGDFFYFIFAEKNWQRNLTIPVLGFWETIKGLSVNGFIQNHINSFVDLLFAIFGVGLAIRSFRFLSISYSVFFLLSILLPLFTPTLSSIPRFLLPIFPIFILIAKFKNKYLSFGYQIAAIMLLTVFIVLFFNGYWVS